MNTTKVLILIALVLALCAIVGIYVYLYISKAKNNSGRKQKHHRRHHHHHKHSSSEHSHHHEHSANVPTIAVESDENKILTCIKERDPGFSGDDMRTYAISCYTLLRSASNAEELQKVRAFTTEDMYFRKKSIATLVASSDENLPDEEIIRSFHYMSYVVMDGIEKLSVIIRAEIVQNLAVPVEDEGFVKKPESDSTEVRKKYRRYRLDFTRADGVQTIGVKPLSAFCCPICGTPFYISESGDCKNCGRPVANGKFYWLLSSFNVIQ